MPRNAMLRMQLTGNKVPDLPKPLDVDAKDQERGARQARRRHNSRQKLKVSEPK